MMDGEDMDGAAKERWLEAGSCAAPCSPPDWSSVKWRRLNKGEIVEAGDWVDACSDGWRDDPVWKLAGRSVGKPAPDPRFPAHRIFRRVLEANATAQAPRGASPETTE